MHVNSICRRLLCAIAVLAIPTHALSAQREPIVAEADDGATLERMLAQLPKHGHEAAWNDAERRWIPVASVAWLEAYLERGGTLTDGQWRFALERSGAIRMRDRWPASVSYAISIDEPFWLGRSQIRVRETNRALRSAAGGSLGWSHCGNFSAGQRYEEAYQPVGKLCVGSHLLEFEVTITRAPTRAELDAAGSARFALLKKRRVVWTGAIARRVEVVAEMEDVLPPRSDPNRDAAVRALLAIELLEDGTIWFDRPPHPGPELADLAISLELELCRLGSCVQTHHVLIEGPPRPFFWNGAFFNIPAGPLEPSTWSIRVRGVNTDALRFWGATHHWSGEFEIPLSEIPRR